MIHRRGRTDKVPGHCRSIPRGNADARRRRRNGLSLIEVVMSTLLVGLILVSALNCMGSVIRSRTDVGDRVRARLVADQLMREILCDDYKDAGFLPLFGPEVGEPAVSAGPRTRYDDVDDYHGWTRSPPQSRDGTPLPNMTGWQRAVTVELVSPSNPGNVVLLDQGIKRITVTVRRNGVTLATSVALRTDRYSIR